MIEIIGFIIIIYIAVQSRANGRMLCDIKNYLRAKEEQDNVRT